MTDIVKVKCDTDRAGKGLTITDSSSSVACHPGNVDKVMKVRKHKATTTYLPIWHEHFNTPSKQTLASDLHQPIEHDFLPKFLRNHDQIERVWSSL